MDANYAADDIISAVKKSNLNFYIQESPFSLFINLRKSFIKNKNGNIIRTPDSGTNDDTMEQIKKLEQEKCKLSDSVEHLEVELNVTKKALHEMRVEFEKVKSENLKAYSNADKAIKENEEIEKENKALNQKNDGLQAKIEALEIEKATTQKSMKLKVIENNNLEKKFKSSIKDLEIENNKLKNEVIEKEDEVRKTVEEKASLQEKMSSLLDLLYGCDQCGLCECECSNSVKEDDDSFLPPQCVTTWDQSSPDITASQTPAAEHPSQSSSSPWTPPPTPPCSSCGGINFGPCPSSVCFGCIPTLQSIPEPDASSPSRTPPGTPPLLRLEQHAARTR